MALVELVAWSKEPASGTGPGKVSHLILGFAKTTGDGMHTHAPGTHAQLCPM